MAPRTLREHQGITQPVLDVARPADFIAAQDPISGEEGDSCTTEVGQGTGVGFGGAEIRLDTEGFIVVHVRRRGGWLTQEGQKVEGPRLGEVGVVAHRELRSILGVGMEGQGDLAEIVLAGGIPAGGAGFLDGGEE